MSSQDRSSANCYFNRLDIKKLFYEIAMERYVVSGSLHFVLQPMYGFNG